jgi:NADH:ubiquinone oxidoreductase subunit F (NADH-binding)/(2Fe-2S) ferredoxin
LPDYSELKSQADEQWKALVVGDRPWVRVGTGLCGQASGALDVLDSIKTESERLEIDITVDEVGCLGMCYAEPLVDVQLPGGSRVFFQNVTPDDVTSIVESYAGKGEMPTAKPFGYLGATPVDGVTDLATLPMMQLQERIALRNAGNIAPADIYQYIANGGYDGLNKALFKMKPEDVIKEMIDSGLRGRGGAGFPTGVKWSFMVRSPGPPKYILCNCEEGDPGAYNDKGILEGDPHTLLEGIILAGYATGATKGFVFIRHGHDGPIDRTQKAIEQAYETGLLGENILGSEFSFDMEISLTGDSYVAGEETALMDSIEGKRAMPRFKPPFPAAFGVWGKPSTVNNVKSLAYAPQIITRGGDWFKSIGAEKCTGTAIICLTGNIKYPGMYEVPMGMEMGQVIDEIGGGVPDGKQFKMLQLGGPLGHVLGPDILPIGLDFDAMKAVGAMLGSGGVIISDEDTCAVDLARVLVAFCQYESCGKCFPCRLGMTNLLEFVERIARNEGRPGDLEMIDQVGETMAAGSLCFHGQLGVNPINSAIQNFPEDFRLHLEEGRCPTGSCDRPVLVPRNTRPYSEDFQPGLVPLTVG